MAQLRSELCCAMESLGLGGWQVQSLVIYDYDKDESHGWRVIGVRELHVAKALFEGHKERLSQRVPSQWGPVHLFELCLWFGHVDTALALAQHGVDGCMVQPYHLGPYAENWPVWECSCANWTVFGSILDECPTCHHYRYRSCKCWHDQTCEYCSWGWPVDKGTWMKDWDAPLHYAVSATVPAARRATKKLLVLELLEMSCSGAELPFVSSKGMARLLDIAILTGNKEAAASLSRKCEVWPLRRWRACELFNSADVLIAAIWAGADFQSLLMQKEEGEYGSLKMYDIPFQVAVFLWLDSSEWQGCMHFFTPEQHVLWRASSLENNLGDHFCHVHVDGEDGSGKLSMDKLEDAPKAGVDISHVRFEVYTCSDDVRVDFTLLCLAILYAQPDCAVACVRLGLQTTGLKHENESLSLLRDYLHSDDSTSERIVHYLDIPMEPVSSALACRAAASAAGQAALRLSWQREAAQKGVAICQVMRKMSRARSWPIALIRDILTFAMEVPQFVEELDLWDFVNDWLNFIHSDSDSGMGEMHGADGSNETLEPRASVHETGTGSASDAPAAPASDPAEAMEVDGKSNDELMTALRASKDHVPPLNVDGVYLLLASQVDTLRLAMCLVKSQANTVFRLTRMATSSHINDLLLDATGPLTTLHKRVLDAGCEVNPEWNPVKALFVPVTEEQMEELRALADQGYELNKDDHILALQEDQDVIAAALKKHLRFKNRPKIKKVGPQSTVAPEEDLEEVDELGTLLEVVCGLRTDSDVGMPSYPNSSEW